MNLKSEVLEIVLVLVEIPNIWPSDSYRVSFSPYGYISWDLAYRSALLRCAELTVQNGYRYFGVVAIENYSS